jgi:hypothetical protein
VSADSPRRERLQRGLILFFLHQRGLILEGADEKVRGVETEARSRCRTPYSGRETEMRDDGLRCAIMAGVGLRERRERRDYAVGV